MSVTAVTSLFRLVLLMLMQELAVLLQHRPAPVALAETSCSSQATVFLTWAATSKSSPAKGLVQAVASLSQPALALGKLPFQEGLRSAMAPVVPSRLLAVLVVVQLACRPVQMMLMRQVAPS